MKKLARFTLTEAELGTIAAQAPLIRPGISEHHALVVCDAIGHLIRALREAEERIEELEDGLEQVTNQLRIALYPD